MREGGAYLQDSMVLLGLYIAHPCEKSMIHEYWTIQRSVCPNI